MVFGHNDLPGVMLAGAVAHLYHALWGAPGRHVVLSSTTTMPPVIPLAGRSRRVGIAGVVDYRPKSTDLVHALAREAGVPVFAGAVVTRARGCQSVKGAEIRLHNGTTLRLPCDLIASSGGFNPNIALTSHLGGGPVWDETIAAFVPGALPPGMEVVGKAAGQGINANIQPCWHVGAFPGKSFVDFQNDVTVKDIRARESGGILLGRASEALHHARHGH